MEFQLKTNHERLWILRNKLRVLEGRGVGGWVSLVVGIKGTYCMEHWVWYINNEFWNTEKIKLIKRKKKERKSRQIIQAK